MSHIISSYAGLIGYYEGYIKGVLAHLKRKDDPTAEDKFIIELLENALTNGNEIWEIVKNKSYEKNYEPSLPQI